jgi:hypothetical protein
LVAEPIKRDGADYREASRRGISTEHGRESLDLDGALAALADFDGCLVVEVEIADQPTVEASARVAADWLRRRPRRAFDLSDSRCVWLRPSHGRRTGFRFSD